MNFRFFLGGLWDFMSCSTNKKKPILFKNVFVLFRFVRDMFQRHRAFAPTRTQRNSMSI